MLSELNKESIRITIQMAKNDLPPPAWDAMVEAGPKEILDQMIIADNQLGPDISAGCDNGHNLMENRKEAEKLVATLIGFM